MADDVGAGGQPHGTAPGAQGGSGQTRIRTGFGTWGLKIVALGLFDAFVLRFIVNLYVQEQYGLFASAAIGLVLINVVLLVDKAYPLRYLLPGLLFMVAMVVYPLFYNIYISFTNYGTGNILTKEQVIAQFESRTYAAPGAVKHPFVLFEDGAGELVVKFTVEGEQFASEGMHVLPLGDIAGVEYDDDGAVVRIGDAVRLERRDVLRRLAPLQQLRLEWDGTFLQLADANHFQELNQRYTYSKAEQTLLDNETGERYTAVDGYFTSGDGERLLPGFRIHIGFANYVRLLTHKAIAGPFMRVFVWTFVWALSSVVLTFGLGLMLALVLNNPNLHLRGLYRSLLIIPYAIPGFVSALVWRGLFNTEFGQVNRLLEALFSTSIPWLQHPLWAKIALLIVNLWLGFPYMMIVTMGALQSISPDLYEAAYSDGARPLQQFRYVTLPLLMTTVAPLLISSFAFNFNNFTLIHLLTGGRPPIAGAAAPAGATDILISFTYRLAFEGGRGADYGLAAAVSLLIFIIIGTITWFNFRFTRAMEEVDRSA